MRSFPQHPQRPRLAHLPSAVLARLKPLVRPPSLTAPERIALATLLAVLAAGAALRAWERSGVRIGPVEDWDTLRELVIRARHDQGGMGYACADDSREGAFAGRTVLAAGAAGGAGGAGTTAGRKPAPARAVDLNAADERALRSLPGVGPATAKAILAHRAARGRFRRVDDLLAVKGIGPAKLATLRPHVRVDAPPPPKDSGGGRAAPPETPPASPPAAASAAESPPSPGKSAPE